MLAVTNRFLPLPTRIATTTDGVIRSSGDEYGMSSRPGTARTRYDERRAGPLRDAVDRLVSTWDGVERTTLSECPAYRVRGQPFAVVTNHGLAVAGLDSVARADLRRRYGTAPVSLTGGGGDWAVTPVGSEDLHGLVAYLRRGYEARAA